MEKKDSYIPATEKNKQDSEIALQFELQPADEELINQAVVAIYNDNKISILEYIKPELYNHIAANLITYGGGWLLEQYEREFKDIDYDQIANILFQQGQARYVATYIDDFRNLSEETLQHLSNQGYRKQVEQYLDNQSKTKKQAA